MVLLIGWNYQQCVASENSGRYSKEELIKIRTSVGYLMAIPKVEDPHLYLEKSEMEGDISRARYKKVLAKLKEKGGISNKEYIGCLERLLNRSQNQSSNKLI
jgi:hypothetical protein